MDAIIRWTWFDGSLAKQEKENFRAYAYERI